MAAILALQFKPQKFLSVSDHGCGALGVDSYRPRALPEVLQLLGRLPHALLKPPLNHRQHGVVEEGGILHDKGFLLRVLLTPEAVVYVLYGHQDDLPQALQQHHVQLREVELQAFL